MHNITKVLTVSTSTRDPVKREPLTTIAPMTCTDLIRVGTAGQDKIKIFLSKSQLYLRVFVSVYICNE